MPLVFVHGVANRQGADWEKNRAARDEFLKAFVAPVLNLDPDQLKPENPYWGGAGVTFAWNQTSVPETVQEYEQFGFEAGEEAQALSVLVARQEGMGLGNTPLQVARNARGSLEPAVNMLWSAAFASLEAPEDASALVRAYRQALAYARVNPKPAWLGQVTETQFAGKLESELINFTGASDVTREDAQDAWQSFGGGGLGAALQEGISRLIHLPTDAAASLTGWLARKQAHAGASLFLGDVFKLLVARQTPDKPGTIVQIVWEALRNAANTKPAGEPLVVIGHSLGGVIVYDILANHDLDLNVDTFVTVGSQSALFEEMGLLGKDRYQAGQLPPRIKQPPNIGRWLNVFDTNDLFGFRVEGVFDGPKDFEYDTGFGFVHAHSGYFQRPSFYRRLAERLG